MMSEASSPSVGESVERPSGSAPSAWPWGDALRVASLSALSIGQPVLDRMQNNPRYLVQLGIEPPALVLITAILLLGVPAALLLPELVAWRFVPRWRRPVHVGTVAFLFLLLAMTVLEKLTGRDYYEWAGLLGYLKLVAAPLAAWAGARLYVRTRWLPATLTLSAAGLMIFPLSFLYHCLDGGGVTISQDEQGTFPQAARPQPVVVVVFDGLCGMSLLNENREIDAVRYPGFARLAGISTWYRNATTVHPRTDNALPAILTGRIPWLERLPVASSYPQNLFSVLHATGQYELVVFEPVTRLCPAELRHWVPETSTADQVVELCQTLSRVYVTTTLPVDIPFDAPGIPRAWFGVNGSGSIDTRRLTGLFIGPWENFRTRQCDHFLRCLAARETPQLSFLHVVLPHDPWCYLPSGKTYRDEAFGLTSPPGAHGIFGEDWGPDPLAAQHAWQRHLLQLGYVDRTMSRLLDRLDEIGLMDDCLLIVGADHGMSFHAGQSRRLPTGDNLADLMSVPLFIKLPGQAGGAVTDRNAETIDIVPTIADVIGLEWPAETDGWSLVDPDLPARPRKTLVFGRETYAAAAAFPEKEARLDLMLATFGSGTQNDRLMALGPRPDLIGRTVENFTIRPSGPVRLDLTDGSRFYEPESNLVPCFFAGRLSGVATDDAPVTLVVAINGVIAATTRTYADPGFLNDWTALVSESFVREGENDVRFYRLLPGETPVLELCQVIGFRRPPPRADS